MQNASAWKQRGDTADNAELLGNEIASLKPVRVPAGTYYAGGSFPSDLPALIEGEGINRSTLIVDANTDVFDVVSASGPTVRNITIRAASPVAVRGSAVKLRGPGLMASCVRSVFEHVVFDGFWYAVDQRGAENTHMLDVWFVNVRRAGVFNDHPNSDAGDHALIDCKWGGAVDPVSKLPLRDVYGIEHVAGGGFRLVAPKVHPYDVFYRFAMRPGAVASGGLTVSGGSIEPCRTAAFELTRQPGATGHWGFVNISGANTFNTHLDTFDAAKVFSIPYDAGGPWLSLVKFSGNAVSLSPESTGIDVSSVDAFDGSGNTFAASGAPGRSCAIRIGRDVRNACVFPNTIVGVAQRIDGARMTHNPEPIDLPTGQTFNGDLVLANGGSGFYAGKRRVAG